MGRKRKKQILNIFVGSSLLGTYERGRDNSISFRYDPGWLSSGKAFPVSLSMPLSSRIWSGAQVSNFFDGLLPDEQIVKDMIATREHTESASTFDLLSAIGRDCVGALRFIPDGDDPGEPKEMQYKQLTEDDISNRLASLGTSPLGLIDKEDDYKISLAGAQEKTAFLQLKDRWFLPLGATPTSHIFKPAMKEGPNGADFSDSPWNEHICLELCRALSLEVTNSKVLLFDGKPVIVVERFDRLWRDGILFRLPQEDICQALGISPTKKYQSDGGPGIEKVLELLNGAISPNKDRLEFLKAQIVFWLLGAIDGHAKNFSVFLTSGGFHLTPLYDVMSASPYRELPEQKIKLAMFVGKNRHYRIKEIQPRHFFQTAQKSGIHKRDVEEIFSFLSENLGRAIEKVNIMAKKMDAPSKTVDPILAGLEKRGRLI
jgi:serine/threonine-protein kinase HipA